jgi:hypothetical protein
VNSDFQPLWSPDGAELLYVPRASLSELRVVQNFFEELKRLAPAN